MKSQEFFYTTKPIYKKVSKEEYLNFIYNYPRDLEGDICGISDPPLITYNDFELANRWPYSVVAKTWDYNDTPGHYYYEPEEKRDYIIMSNYEEVFNSRTGNRAEAGE